MRTIVYETGGMRRVHLRGRANSLKRLLGHASGFNLGLFLRTLTGIGMPRSLQGRAAVALALCVAFSGLVSDHLLFRRKDTPWPIE